MRNRKVWVEAGLSMTFQQNLTYLIMGFTNFTKSLSKNKVLYIILALFLLSKLPFLLKPHNILWDEAVYLGIGKAIYSAGQLGLWEPIRPLGLPMLTGVFWKLGLNQILFSEILALAFAVGLIVTVYVVGKNIFNSQTAAIGTALLAFTPIFFEQSSLVLTEIPSIFFALLAVYFFIKNKYALSGLFAGLSFMFKFPLGLVFVGLFSLSVFNYFKTSKSAKSDLVKLAVAFAIPVVPFIVLNYLLYSSQAANPLQAALIPLLLAAPHQSNPVNAVQVSGIIGMIYNYAFYVIELIRQNPTLLFAIPGIVLVFVNKKIRTVPLLISFLLLLAYFSLIINKQMRFSIAFLPFVALFSGYGMAELSAIARKRKGFVKKLSVASIFLITILSIWLVARADVEIYKARPAVELAITSEVYKYFAANPPSGAILTTDPGIAAFVDAKIYPYYDSPSAAFEAYDKFREKSAYILYHPRFFPCEPYGPECEEVKSRLLAKIKAENEEMFHRDYGYAEYFIFLTK